MKRIKFLYDSILCSLDKFSKDFKKYERQIQTLLREKSEKKEPSLFETYFSYLQRNDIKYIQYLRFQKEKKKINLLLHKIVKNFYDYTKKYDAFKLYTSNKILKRVQLNTIKKICHKCDDLNDKILNKLIMDFNAEYNDYLQNVKEINEMVLKLKTEISIIEHLVFNNFEFKRKVNYTSLEKINIKDLRTGDLIFFDESLKQTRSFVTRQIMKITKTSISHLAMFYKQEANSYLIFQARGANRKKTYLSNFNLKKGYKYVILRLRHDLNENEKKLLQKKILNYINIEFGFFKMCGIGLNLFLLNLYKDWFPFIDQGKNPLASSRVFCSEVIAKIYREIGFNISNKEDTSLTSPIDIFNSPELKTIGYIEG